MTDPVTDAEYNPLDYDNLTLNCVRELMSRGPYSPPLSRAFPGAGVYALFYAGDLSVYAPIQSPDASHPIYVGKAVPPGARTGRTSILGSPSRALHGRLQQHIGSIQAASNLRLEDFRFRYLVVTPLWITMAERFLIEHYRPLWNVFLDGFGNHAPGKGRSESEISWWDALHPGRSWAALLRQTRTQSQAEERVRQFLSASATEQAALTTAALETGRAET